MTDRHGKIRPTIR